MRKNNGHRLWIQTFLLLAAFSCGCSTLISSATREFGTNLSETIMNSNDLDTVGEAIPAYLIFLDSLVTQKAGQQDLKRDEPRLRSAAQLYTLYAGFFITDEDRNRTLTAKALAYAQRACCAADPNLCRLPLLDFEAFDTTVAALKPKHLPCLYTLGISWASWVSARRDEMEAITVIARIERIMKKIIGLDESYHHGSAHTYLGILATLLPPALGGHPEEGKIHFEKAIQISGGKDLMAKVIYAQSYARMMFDRKLHDGILKQVLDSSPDVAGLVLTNTLARQKAKELLNSADGYF